MYTVHMAPLLLPALRQNENPFPLATNIITSLRIFRALFDARCNIKIRHAKPRGNVFDIPKGGE